VQKISNIVGTNSIDAVVTEPYLGPSNLKHANIKRVSELGAIKKELSELYLGAFWEFKKVLKSGGRVVMVWPVWQIGANQWQDRVDESKLSYLPIIDQVIKLGFRKINLLPAELRQQSGIKLNERRSLIYSRPNQMVLREIMVFAKK
jgi:tRNA G10  N-methylase Trm11